MTKAKKKEDIREGAGSKGTDGTLEGEGLNYHLWT